MKGAKDSYKKDQFFVDFSEVYVISKVKGQGATSEKALIHYKPYYPAHNEGTLTFSETLSGFEGSYKRRLVSKKQAKSLIGGLQQVPEAYEYDSDDLEEAIKLSQIERLMVGVAYLSNEMLVGEPELSYTKRSMYRTLMTYISNEFAVVMNSTPLKIRRKMTRVLKASVEK